MTNNHRFNIGQEVLKTNSDGSTSRGIVVDSWVKMAGQYKGHIEVMFIGAQYGVSSALPDDLTPVPVYELPTSGAFFDVLGTNWSVEPAEDGTPRYFVGTDEHRPEFVSTLGPFVLQYTEADLEKMLASLDNDQKGA